jgi:hypothetical protein
MVNNKIWLGILILVLVFGMMLVSCGDGDGDGSTSGDGGAKSITITGIIGIPGNPDMVYFGVWKNHDINKGGLVAEGEGRISNNSVTFSLFKGDDPFTGSGSYVLIPEFWSEGFSDEIPYVYTNGQTLVALGITASDNESSFFAKLPRYSISSATSTIPFSKFAKVPDR